MVDSKAYRSVAQMVVLWDLQMAVETAERMEIHSVAMTVERLVVCSVAQKVVPTADLLAEKSDAASVEMLVVALADWLVAELAGRSDCYWADQLGCFWVAEKVAQMVVPLEIYSAVKSAVE